MPIGNFIIAVSWKGDSICQGLYGRSPIRKRGVLPRLFDGEVIKKDVVGESLGLDTDVAIWRFFRPHWAALSAKQDAVDSVCKRCDLGCELVLFQPLVAWFLRSRAQSDLLAGKSSNLEPFGSAFFRASHPHSQNPAARGDLEQFLDGLDAAT